MQRELLVSLPKVLGLVDRTLIIPNTFTVTLRLAPLLPTNVAVVQFPDVRKATEAVIEIMNQGVGIRA